MPANELPKRFVTLDVYKSVAMTVVLCLSALEHIRACRGMDCNWTQPTFYFEYMSGLFFVLQGIGNARSIVRQHDAGATWWRVMRVQLLRGGLMIAAAATLHVVAQRLRQHVKAYVDDAPVKQVWPEYNRWVGFFEARALVYHGVCTILSSAFLITFLVAFAARGRPRVPKVLLVAAGAVLVANAPLRELLDAATCCEVAEKPASGFPYRRGANSTKCERRTPVTSAGNSLPFRVPRRCTRVVGNGTAAEGSPFDPCDFNVTGGGAKCAFCLRTPTSSEKGQQKGAPKSL